MPKLVIKGKKPYIDYMETHLKKEHPSTKKRMRRIDNGGKKKMASNGVARAYNNYIKKPIKDTYHSLQRSWRRYTK